MALFDESLYQGGIASDLFEDRRYFTDPDEFWRLQNCAIAAERDALLAAGWREVHIVAPDQRFQAWEFEKVAKSRGGAVYMDVEPDGSVTVHKGLLPMDQTLTERAQKHKARREAVMIEMAQAQRQEEMPVSMLTAHRSKPSALRYVLG